MVPVVTVLQRGQLVSVTSLYYMSGRTHSDRRLLLVARVRRFVPVFGSARARWRIVGVVVAMVP
jgi:hypothetical protein